MCLLAVMSPNAIPKKKDLECSACNNPHGFGYAIITPDGILTNRGMSARKMIAEFLEKRKQYPAGHAMFHARFATHGVKNEENCHPFIVGGDKRTYLAHNGILDVDIHATDRRSDTRIFAEDILPRMGGVTSLDDDNIWKILGKWASGNKIAVLTVDPDARDNCYILNEGLGHWDNEGIWWSNDTYKPAVWDKTWNQYFTKNPDVNEAELLDSWGGRDIVTCQGCGSLPFVDANPYYCEMCMSCYDCGQIYDGECLCWAPEMDAWATQKRNETHTLGRLI